MRIRIDELPEDWDAHLTLEVDADGALVAAEGSSGGETARVVDDELVATGVTRTTTRRIDLEPDGFRVVTAVEVRHAGAGRSEVEAEARRLLGELGRMDGRWCAGCGRVAACGDPEVRMVSFGRGPAPVLVCDRCLDRASRMLAEEAHNGGA